MLNSALSPFRNLFITAVCLGVSFTGRDSHGQDLNNHPIIDRGKEFKYFHAASDNITDQTSQHYFDYPSEFLVKVDQNIIKTNFHGLFYKKLFIDCPVPPEWMTGNHIKRIWSHPGYRDDFEKSWTELVNRLFLHYSDKIKNSSDLTAEILKDTKPFIDKDLNWRLFPRYLARFVENNITVDQVGTTDEFKKLYGSKKLPEEVILNLLIHKVSKEDLINENGNTSLAIARKNENTFHNLFKEYCENNNLIYNKSNVDNFVLNELGISKTPSLKDYNSKLLLGYSTIDGEAVFHSVVNLMRLNDIKKIENKKIREDALNEFFDNLMVFCMADQNAEAQKVFEGGSGLKILSRANSEGKIKLITFKVNPLSVISPEDQITGFLEKLTLNGSSKIKNFAINAHGSPNNMSLVIPYNGNSFTTENKGSLSFDDGKIFEKIGTHMDQNQGLIHLHSCDTAGPQGENIFGYPKNNIADFIAIKSGVPVIAPSPSIRNGSYAVLRNSDGRSTPLPCYGLCTYFICPTLIREDKSTTRNPKVIGLIKNIFGRK